MRCQTGYMSKRMKPISYVSILSHKPCTLSTLAWRGDAGKKISGEKKERKKERKNESRASTGTLNFSHKKVKLDFLPHKPPHSKTLKFRVLNINKFVL